MILANFISILEYGAKIFLAVMGFISFDDINEKPIYPTDQDQLAYQNVNYVESLKAGELADSKMTYYADPTYFVKEYEPEYFMIANQLNFATTNELTELNCQSEILPVETENYFVIESKALNDFEILVLLDNEKSELETFIKVIDLKNISSKVANSAKLLNISSSTTIN